MISFENILRENNLKTTHQRLAILNEIERAGHIDIDNLYSIIKENFPTMALGTLYRNLTELKDKEILSEVKIPKQKNVYEVTKEKHIHLVCQKCGKVEDFPFIDESVVANVADKSGYALDSVQVSMSGTCKDCR